MGVDHIADVSAESLHLDRCWALSEPRLAYEPMTGCWLWTGPVNRGGYGRANVAVRGGGHRPFLLHRVSHAHHVGAVPRGTLVCHRCDTRRCLNPDHLFLGSYLDNNRDRTAKGRWAGRTDFSGPRKSAKLTRESVAELRARRTKGETLASIASDLGVTEGAVSMAANRVTWRHVP